MHRHISIANGLQSRGGFRHREPSIGRCRHSVVIRSILLTLMFLVASCASSSSLDSAVESPEISTTSAATTVGSSATSRPTTTVDEPNWKEPPPLLLRADGQEIVPAWLAYCWSGDGDGYCADYGLEDPPVLSASGPIEIVWPLVGWQFEVGSDNFCQPGVARVDQRDDQPRVVISGGAGRYEFNLRGDGPEGGTDYVFAVDYLGVEPSFPVGTIAPLSLVQDGESAVSLTGSPADVDIVDAGITLVADDGATLKFPMKVNRASQCSTTLAPSSGMTDAAKRFGTPPWAFTLQIELADGRQLHTNGHTAFWALTLPPPEPANFRSIEDPLDEVLRSSLLTEHLPD
jgi:hypothetical protein